MNRVVIVTGASSGIGAAVTEKFLSEGADVYALDVAHASSLRDEASGLLPRRLDVTSESDWEAFAGELASTTGKVDAVIHCAGIVDVEDVDDLNLDRWNAVLGVNLTGIFLGSKHLHTLLAQSSSPSQVNVSSMLSNVAGFGTGIGYIASKGGVRSLTKDLAVRWASDGIRVNSVHPGFVRTPILEGLDMTEAIARTPLGRLGEPEEVAHLIAYLASEHAGFITGSEIVIDGGYTAQ